ncbi:uncharacterized protein LOC144729419 isoform X2 [Lampetra planeri]
MHLSPRTTDGVHSTFIPLLSIHPLPKYRCYNLHVKSSPVYTRALSRTSIHLLNLRLTNHPVLILTSILVSHHHPVHQQSVSYNLIHLTKYHGHHLKHQTSPPPSLSMPSPPPSQTSSTSSLQISPPPSLNMPSPPPSQTSSPPLYMPSPPPSQTSSPSSVYKSHHHLSTCPHHLKHQTSSPPSNLFTISSLHALTTTISNIKHPHHLSTCPHHHHLKHQTSSPSLYMPSPPPSQTSNILTTFSLHALTTTISNILTIFSLQISPPPPSHSTSSTVHPSRPCVDAEAEHGYAALLPFNNNKEEEEESSNRKKMRSRKIIGRSGRTELCSTEHPILVPAIRSTHNELEKNRRAHLRKCLERLKEMVPLEAECSRHTTLGLLNKAKNHIKRLEEQDRRAQHQKDQLEREHRYLRRRLEQLQGAPVTVERMRTDSLGSALSSERSDSDREVDVDVESLELSVGGETDNLSVGSVSDGESSGSSILASSASDGGYSSSSLKWPSFC